MVFNKNIGDVYGRYIHTAYIYIYSIYIYIYTAFIYIYIHMYMYVYMCIYVYIMNIHMYYSKPSSYMADRYYTSSTIWTSFSGTEGLSAQTSIWVGNETSKTFGEKWESKLRKGETWQF